ncbi:PREDICTED: probable G-protein coupled receptor 142 [Chrysochloris asiatica]|uniref:Probable G-protein coupled receptor 142 n=1 Tax=Chrysochloris asiatica TaxID=185453 RepID=A0A9B0TQU9_CHRAS|nr:PREDICTED: probable G-protein coupled receptor 142 [Chrysochloris asiatica]
MRCPCPEVWLPQLSPALLFVSPGSVRWEIPRANNCLASLVRIGTPGNAGRELQGLAGKATAGQSRMTLLPTPNGSGSSRELEGPWPEIPDRSPCVAGIIPVIYYSILLGLGLPVNLLTSVALARLATRTRKPSYYYLLALTASDIVTQVVIVFVGFLLQGAVLAREVPPAVVRTANILEFAANHASVWLAVLLTLDRYSALCRPLHHRVASSPGRTRRAIAAVLGVALLTGIPFYWWLDVWRDADPPSTLDKVLKWAHCLTVYFIPCGIFLITNSTIIFRLRQRGQGGLRPHVGKSTAILLGVTTLFALLWAPRIFVMLYHLYVAPVHRDWRVHLALDVANMAAMFNTAVNFGLYCFVSKTFRVTVREVIHDAHLPCTLGSRPKCMVVEPVLKLQDSLKGQKWRRSRTCRFIPVGANKNYKDMRYVIIQGNAKAQKIARPASRQPPATPQLGFRQWRPRKPQAGQGTAGTGPRLEAKLPGPALLEAPPLLGNSEPLWYHVLSGLKQTHSIASAPPQPAGSDHALLAIPQATHEAPHPGDPHRALSASLEPWSCSTTAPCSVRRGPFGAHVLAS